MGIKLSELLPKKKIEFDDLSGKKIGVDFSNAAYQFLASIRQADGTPLTDNHGNITSHLVGLFSRTTNLMARGVKICYVFDGKPPALKFGTTAEREERKLSAEEKLREAEEEEDIMAMMKYSKQSMRLTSKMVEEAKELIAALGLPGIQAPSEADAQLSFMCAKGDIWAAATSDADPMLHGCPRTITNLTISQRKKLASGKTMGISPELVELTELLKNLEINQDQLIVLGILVGTDYNPGGIKGIGPKKALKLVKIAKNAKDFEKIFNDLNADFNWKEIYSLFKQMPVEKKYNLSWGNVDIDKIKEILVERHNFSDERVESSLSKLINVKAAKGNSKLDSWFK
ncbi:MAG: flap endonuclease-1 [Candidatus Nanoarchaeia archaeon]|nr:flap endonuclease-1 [Candidatus Nanoarchaeia archaeon]